MDIRSGTIVDPEPDHRACGAAFIPASGGQFDGGTASRQSKPPGPRSSRMLCHRREGFLRAAEWIYITSQRAAMPHSIVTVFHPVRPYQRHLT
jgi:hypothetical protein